MTYEKMQRMTTKAIIDEIVGLSNVLIQRHMLKESNPPAPAWFTEELYKADYAYNSIQSAIDAPDGEDVSFADCITEGGGK